MMRPRSCLKMLNSFVVKTFENLKSSFHLVWEKEKQALGNKAIKRECIYSNMSYKKSLIPTQLFLDL